MVFAAGLGTRMRPLTLTVPKPLIKVGGKALIDHILAHFVKAGVRRAIVNVHYLADQIESHFAGSQDMEIIISDERAQLLDQGGGIKKVLDLLLPDPFFICNTDAFWLEGPHSNIQRLAELWDPERMDALLLVASMTHSVGVDWPGDFTLDAEGRLHKRAERQVAPFVYSGVGIIKPQLFQGEPADVFMLAPILFAAAEKNRLFGLRLDGLWLHVGMPEAVADAERALARSIL